jgi:putative inorganic carbon (HCO3(-)) transporter
MLGLFTYLGLLTALTIGTMLRPAIGVAGVLCLFGLKQWGQTTTTIFAEHPLVTNVAVAVLVIVGVIRVAFKRQCLFCRIPPAAIFVAAMYLYAFMTTVWALDTQRSLDEWATLGPYIATIALLAPLLVDDLTDVRAAFLWTMYVGGAICFLVLVFGSWGYRGLELGTGSDTSETNPLALASLAGTVMLTSSMFILQKRQIVLRIIAAALVPIALAVVLRTGSRGQLLAIVPSFAVACLIAFRLNSLRSLAALSLTTLLIIGLGWWGSTLIQINSSRWTGTASASDDVQGRLYMAQTLIKAALAHPVTIIFGLGNSSSYEVLGIYPHITILEVIAEEGIAGLILYLGILVCAVGSIIRVSRSMAANAFERNIAAILAALFCFELMLSWKQGTLLSSFYVFAYAIILGRIAMRVSERSLAEKPVRSALNLPLFPNLLR